MVGYGEKEEKWRKWEGKGKWRRGRRVGLKEEKKG
jgi:hypothetical protein